MTEGSEIQLRVPGSREYVLVIRTALGGAAILKNLDVDTMDDLRMAADEACDCLLHQDLPVRALTVTIRDRDARLAVSIEAELMGDGMGGGEEDRAIVQAVLETLAPEVKLITTPGGCIRRIDLMLPRVAV